MRRRTEKVCDFDTASIADGLHLKLLGVDGF
jgi:hypothetical protein